MENVRKVMKVLKQYNLKILCVIGLLSSLIAYNHQQSLVLNSIISIEVLVTLLSYSNVSGYYFKWSIYIAIFCLSIAIFSPIIWLGVYPCASLCIYQRHKIVGYDEMVKKLKTENEELKKQILEQNKNTPSVCAICFETFNSLNNKKCSIKGCGHVYCESCLLKLLDDKEINSQPGSAKCPSCSEYFIKSSLQNIYFP